MKTKTKKIAESAMLIAIGTVLSLFTFQGLWVYGGGITICSMLPLVILAHRYGTKWGMLCAVVYSVLQLVLGMNSVTYATTAFSVVMIVLFDYIIAYSVIGLSACFNNIIKDRRLSIVLGIVFSFSLRFLCHFISGLVVWEVIFPNKLAMAPAIYSLSYNGSYMLPEVIITSLLAVLLYKPLERYWLGTDIAQ